MRWRNKISWMAFEKGFSIQELFLNAIKEAYLQASVPKTKLEYYLSQESVIHSLMSLPLSQCILQLKYIRSELNYPRTYIVDNFDLQP